MTARFSLTIEKASTLVKTRAFLVGSVMGLLSGGLSCGLKMLDQHYDDKIIAMLIPETVVFNVFVVFASLVAAFRTGHALSRYTDAAAYLHKLNACWFDSASTLVAFCRVSTKPEATIDQFQQTVIRLVSLLSASCLDGLQGRDQRDYGHRFQILGINDLDENTQQAILDSDCKVECVFQMIQHLVVDGMKTGVLSIAPPILSRSIQELGAGLLTYHEAKKLACVPFPYAYNLIVAVILLCEAIYIPFMMVVFTKGPPSAFFYTFGGTFLLWFINITADSLDNPFSKAAQTLEATHVQEELNKQLSQLVLQSSCPTPSVRPESLGVGRRQSMENVRRESFHTWANGTTSMTTADSVGPTHSTSSAPSPASPPTSSPAVAASGLGGAAKESEIDTAGGHGPPPAADGRDGVPKEPHRNGASRATHDTGNLDRGTPAPSTHGGDKPVDTDEKEGPPDKGRGSTRRNPASPSDAGGPPGIGSATLASLRASVQHQGHVGNPA